MNDLFAVKRLSAVEVDATSSHQHELNATKLRLALGIDEARAEGRLTLAIHRIETQEPLILEGKYTLYNSREGKPRSAEYRLYYDLPDFGSWAAPGDLLVVFRAPGSATNLLAIVARRGTPLEKKLQGVLDVGELPEIREFLARRGKPLNPDEAFDVVEPLLHWPDISHQRSDFASLPLYRAAIRARQLPHTRAMAEAAHQVYAVHRRSRVEPDQFLTRALEIESELYFSLERAILEPRVLALKASEGAGLDQLLELAMSCLQSRKSRRGQSLQLHFAKLLDLESVPFAAQCVTERGERPDFIVPGCKQYHDRHYPQNHVRMVGCKTKVRERWRQYLEEADRIPIKYHLSLDPDWTDDTIRKMHESNLRSFLPKVILSEHYDHRPTRQLLGTVRELITELRAVI